jgi:hypothetical protein
LPAYRLALPYERPPLRRRVSGFALALGINLLLLFLLLGLGVQLPMSKKGEPGALVIDLSLSTPKAQREERKEEPLRHEQPKPVPKLDLAVLRIEAKNLHALPLGDSARLAVGQSVVAIGNPFGLGQTVTAGIVSATNRALAQGDERRFIQTDAPINPGNSGGPLIDAAGRVIGINSALFSPDPRGQGNVGIGFAIPSNVVRGVLQQVGK